jgi:hypothetical protein
MDKNFCISKTTFHQLAVVNGDKTKCGRPVGKMKKVVRGTDCWPMSPCKGCGLEIGA